jgi:DeoR/GlpR family transcriptional regulator of sugar metabolism
MVDGASQVIGLVDHTKWGRAAFATFCRTEKLTAVVADDLAPLGMADAVRLAGIDLRLVAVTDARDAGSPAQARSSRSTPW